MISFIYNLKYICLLYLVDAYLHVRKMRTPRKSRSLKPWEILPVGSKIQAYVHEVDAERRRVGLTTYTPDKWDVMLPSRDKDDMIPDDDDDEELGGSARAANIRALERTLALGDEDEEDEEEGEDMTMEEIAAAVKDEGRRARILMDDTLEYGNAVNKDGVPVPKEQRTSYDDEEGEEISVDELFEELSNGRPFITVSDIMKWDYLTELVVEGEVDRDTVMELFKEAGAKGGKLSSVDELDDFIELLTEQLGLVEVGSEGDDEGDEEGDTEGEGVELSDLEDGEDDSKFYAMSDDTDQEEGDEDEIFIESISYEVINDEEEALLSALDLTDDEGVVIQEKDITNEETLSLSQHYEKKSKNTDLLKYVFNVVSHNKDHVLLTDVLEWDFVKALFEQGTLSSDKHLAQVFSKCSPKGGKLRLTEFGLLVDLLGQLEQPINKGSTIPTTAATTTIASAKPVPTTSPTKGGGNIKVESTKVQANIADEEDDVEDFEDNDLDVAIDEIFANKKVHLIDNMSV